MNLAQLDYYFPFVVLIYGFAMTACLNSKWFIKNLESRVPQALAAQFISHRTLGLVCLFVGALWSVQNLMLSEPPF